ncbi:hypothetical protein BDD12DRAFT_323583 [Trichophaea hybrida]|nr:hypothetical protein BDD12DRAFT_323583 [Trichophaea hybrida]
MLEDKPEKLIECVTCMDDEIPAKEAAKLACGHWFCNECLKRLFTLSLTDPAHMPPKCCQSDHIPLKHVDKLLSYQNKKLWNKKYLEYTTANRIYCPTTDCGEWIQPKDIQGGIGQCQKCKNKVCSTCNGKAHGDGACPQDPDMIKFFETAQKHKYQKCYNCKAMVELERGCNHMTCHCTAQFCYVCGSKWKTCDCPWFNYEPGEAEREYVVPDWNAREPVLPPQVADRPQRGNRREQLREDEEVARRIAREMGPGEDLAREYYELPIDPLAALGTLGLGLRNGIRRLAADYVVGAQEPRPHLERRRGGAVAGPGLGLGLARATGGAAAFYGAAARPVPAQAAAVNVEANNAAPAPVPRRQPVHVPALQRVPRVATF